MQHRLAIVGRSGGTNLGQSFFNAALDLRYEATFYDDVHAYSRNRLINALRWRLFDRKPARMDRFQERLIRDATQNQFTVLVSSGLTPLDSHCLATLSAQNVLTLHFSSDDPWNPTQRSQWFLDSLSAYHHIFTPRLANYTQLEQIAPGRVSVLPFAFDEQLTFKHLEDIKSQAGEAIRHDAPDLSTSLLFVGGADSSRLAFIRELIREGVPVCLAGAYWNRHNDLKCSDLGHCPPGQIAGYTKQAFANLILVRHQNRDGHTMRSFEAAALGGCLLVEDTLDHRNFFGGDAGQVLFFQDAETCARQFFRLQAEPSLCGRLGEGVKKQIWASHHTYADRLQTMLATC